MTNYRERARQAQSRVQDNGIHDGRSFGSPNNKENQGENSGVEKSPGKNMGLLSPTNMRSPGGRLRLEMQKLEAKNLELVEEMQKMKQKGTIDQMGAPIHVDDEKEEDEDEGDEATCTEEEELVVELSGRLSLAEVFLIRAQNTPKPELNLGAMVGCTERESWPLLSSDSEELPAEGTCLSTSRNRSRNPNPDPIPNRNPDAISLPWKASYQQIARVWARFTQGYRDHQQDQAHTPSYNPPLGF